MQCLDTQEAGLRCYRNWLLSRPIIILTGITFFQPREIRFCIPIGVQIGLEKKLIVYSKKSQGCSEIAPVLLEMWADIRLSQTA